MTATADRLHFPPLPPEADQRGGSPALVVAEYLHVIRHAITNHPRSLQKAIGPSEVGDPCVRRLGYKHQQVPPRNPGPPNWKATMGTGAHLWLADAFDRENARIAQAGNSERWLVETRVTCGEVAGVPLEGSCDLFDTWTGTVVDHKTVGPSQLRKYRANGPGDQYRAQAHLYGRGWQLAGLDPRTVAVAFLPRDGALSDAYVWTEPYSERVALDALQRLQGITVACDVMGNDALATLPTAPAYCGTCPWFVAGSTDPATGCPGDPGAAIRPAQDQLAGLVG